jgi:hypothetical protein
MLVMIVCGTALLSETGAFARRKLIQTYELLAKENVGIVLECPAQERGAYFQVRRGERVKAAKFVAQGGISHVNGYKYIQVTIVSGLKPRDKVCRFRLCRKHSGDNVLVYKKCSARTSMREP